MTDRDIKVGFVGHQTISGKDEAFLFTVKTNVNDIIVSIEVAGLPRFSGEFQVSFENLNYDKRIICESFYNYIFSLLFRY